MNNELQEYTNLSIDAKILQFQLYRKMFGNLPQPDFLLDRADWIYNREIGDFVCKQIQDSFADLCCGARNGSVKCIEKLMTVHSQNDKAAFVIADLIQHIASQPFDQHPMQFHMLLRCYEDTFRRGGWTDTQLSVHKSNIELIKCHLNLCIERLLFNIPRDQIDQRYELQKVCKDLISRATNLIQRVKNGSHTDANSELFYGEPSSSKDSSMPE